MRGYLFNEVSEVPDGPGIYAWYYNYLLRQADLNALETKLDGHTNEEERWEEIESFLKRHIYGPLEETPYKVAIYGALKPRYRGEVGHVPAVTDGLVRRASQDFDRLRKLDEVLRATLPYFSSPIYIGMARVSLRQRLERHRDLISKYREGQLERPSWYSTEGSDPFLASAHRERTEAQMAHSFAYEVAVVRKFAPSRLVVFTKPLAAGDIALDAENVLNRLNFPLCGRN